LSSARSRALAVLPKALAACVAVLAIDQGTKALVNSLIDRGESVEVLPFLSIENTRNEGVAFGLGGDVSTLFVTLELCFLVFLMVSLSVWDTSSSRVWLPTGLLVGGALGNLVDRLREGAVIDFIDFSFWPTFNLADTAIVIGVAVLLLMVQQENRDERAQPP
jgi:signal peptidase II